MTRAQLTACACFGSAALLLAAFAFQHFGGMAPCKLCIWQRYPHVLAIVVGGLCLVFHQRSLALVGVLATLATAMIGFYHAGVEQGWWQGPATCSSGDIGGISAEALLEQIMAAPLVRCDEIPWEIFGISMAGWNAIASLALAAIWMIAYRRT